MHYWNTPPGGLSDGVVYDRATGLYTVGYYESRFDLATRWGAAARELLDVYALDYAPVAPGSGITVRDATDQRNAWIDSVARRFIPGFDMWGGGVGPTFNV